MRFLEAIPRARDLCTSSSTRTSGSRATTARTSRGCSSASSRPRAAATPRCYDAITVYLSRVADTPGRKVLVLFTDGEDTTSADPCAGGAAAGALERGDDLSRRVHGRRTRPGSAARCAPARSCTQLAEMTGGQVFAPARLAGAGRASTTTILDELAASTCSGYVSDNLNRDGKFRKHQGPSCKRPALQGAPPRRATTRPPRTRPRRARPRSGSGRRLERFEQRLELALELAHAPLQLGQLREHRARLEPGAVLDGRGAGDDRARLHRAGDAGLGGGDRRRRRSSRWPATPTWPARVTRSPICVLPAMPDLAGEHACPRRS